MASRAVPTFTIELDRARTVRMTCGALVDAELLSGADFARKGIGALNVTQVTALLYACLRHDDPELTLEKLRSEIVLPSDLPGIYETLGEAWASFFPEPDAAGEGEGKKPTPLKGKKAAA